jgi:hypothetical protein
VLGVVAIDISLTEMRRQSLIAVSLISLAVQEVTSAAVGGIFPAASTGAAPTSWASSRAISII